MPHQCATIPAALNHRRRVLCVKLIRSRVVSPRLPLESPRGHGHDRDAGFVHTSHLRSTLSSPYSMPSSSPMQQKLVDEVDGLRDGHGPHLGFNTNTVAD